MSDPIFCYQNLYESASAVAVTSEASGFLKENAYDWRTDDFWKATSSATNYLQADMGSNTAVDYGAIYAHDIHTQGATISLEYADDGAYSVNLTTAFTITPTTSAPLIRTFTSVSKRYWRYKVTGGAAGASIGVLSFGARLDSPVPLGFGFMPPTFARTPQLMPHRAQKGAFVGASVQRRGVKFNVPLTYLADTWIRSNWDTFQDHFETKPFFFAWDTGSHEAEAVYCWADRTQTPPKYQTHNLMSVTLKLVGFYL